MPYPPTDAAVLDAPPAEIEEAPVTPVDDILVEEDLLVEDVSIDGMCGVY
jgi:mycofactocin precursor